MNLIEVCKLSDLEDRQPKHFLIENIDLVIIRYDDLSTFSKDMHYLTGISYAGIGISQT